jgi:hydrogenase maturation protease
LVDDIANTVLYEGYILYPYRPSALKNRHRFNFGVVVPATESAALASGDKAQLQATGLLRAGWDSTISVRVRFLQVVARRVGRIASAPDGSGDVPPPDRIEFVDTLEVNGKVYRGREEAVAREVRVTGRLNDLARSDMRQAFEWTAEDLVQPLRSGEGSLIGAIVRRKEAVAAEVVVSSEAAGAGLFRITVRISNVTPPAGDASSTRSGWLMRSLVSTHVILHVDRGEWLSLLDPPAEAREQMRSCQQVGLWPVLVGEPGDRDALLASPIILYDYPEIAPESAGDFCDGTEIDEMLALRILTMTDKEKQEMREGDEHAKRMLERTESLSEEHLMRLHGVLRGLRPLNDEGQS